MEKITMQELSEKIMNDVALKAQADQITGSGEELQQKIRDFAASLGYELEEEMTGKMSLDELDAVSGGNIFTMTENEAKRAGIELIKEDGTPGEFHWYYNTGDYYFDGKKIDYETARDIYNMTIKHINGPWKFRDYDEYLNLKAIDRRHEQQG